MTRQDKKSRELVILRTAYSMRSHPDVMFGEKPDFTLTDANGVKFGVEVTEFYTTGSTARLNNINAYFDDLVKNKEFRHKEDIKNFTVDDFKIHTQDGQEKGTVRGVFMKAMSLADKMKILNSVISDKNKKFEQYDQNLSRIELLIHDSDSLFGLAKPEDIGSILMHYVSPELVESSKFSDVLLIFNTNEHEYIVSILDNILIGTIASAVSFVHEHHNDINDLIADDVLPIDFVAAIFRHNGFKKVQPVYFEIDGKKKAGIEIGNSVICTDESGNTLYRGPHSPIGTSARNDSLDTDLPPPVVKKYDEFMQKHAWADSVFRGREKLPSPKIKRPVKSKCPAQGAPEDYTTKCYTD